MKNIRWAVILLTTSLWGQGSVSISGTVTDATGAGISAAVVTVRNVETGAIRKVVTDDGGRYVAASLVVGEYEVEAEKTGFSPELKKGITLVVGQQAEVSLTLPLGELRQLVEVEEAPPVVNTSTKDTSGLVGERQVKNLPLNGRSYDELVNLNPGIVNYTSERSGGVGVSNSAIGNMFAVSGHRPQENLFLLNGIEYTSASEINLTPGGASGQLLGVDAVREFSVVTDAYGAEYGKRPGAQVSIVTASGTNQLHGSVYEFLRNSDLDARNFFDQGTIPQFQRNEFGGSLGGPIQKDKTFVFGNYEGFRQHLGLSDLTLVPDNAARKAAVPSVQPLLALWPVQNGPELGAGIAEAFSHPLQTIREDFGTARVDHTFSEKDVLFGVYTIDDSGDQTPSANPLSRVVESLREQVASVEETHVFSPRVLNTARFGFSRGAYFFDGQSLVDVPGWVEGRPIGTLIVGGGTASNGASQITQAGTNAGSNLTAVRNLFTFEDHVNFNRGRHQWQVGVWLQRVQANDNMAQAQNGQASFSSLATFLTGTVNTFTAVPSPTLLGWRSLEGSAYIQDTIKLTPRLELSAGFRFESTNGWNEVHGRASNYLFDANGVIETQPHIGTSVFSVNNAKFLPEPRAGIAWDVFGKGNTVIHAGFGVYHNLLDDLSFRLDQNAPFNTTLSLKKVAIGSIHLVPGAPLPAGGLIGPARRAAGLEDRDGAGVLIQGGAEDRAQYIADRGIRGLARLPRDFCSGRQRARGDDLPGVSVPGDTCRRHGLLSIGRQAGEPETGQHDELVFERRQQLQRPGGGREPPLQPRAAIARRVHVLQKPGRRRHLEQQRGRERSGFRDVPATSGAGLGSFDIQREELGDFQRGLRSTLRPRQEVPERRSRLAGKGGRRLVTERHWNVAVRLPVHAAVGIQPLEQR